jgi:hypothetical protein
MTYYVDKEPVLRIDRILIEEKGSTNEGLVEKIGCESCKPLKQVKASACLEHEECDHLLNEQTGNDGAPLDVRPVLGRRPKAKLEHDKTEHGDCAVAIVRALIPQPRIRDHIICIYIYYVFSKNRRPTYIFKLETERRAHDDSEESKPAQAITGVSREGEERPLDERNPHRLDGARDD